VARWHAPVIVDLSLAGKPAREGGDRARDGVSRQVVTAADQKAQRLLTGRVSSRLIRKRYRFVVGRDAFLVE
jgi:hypothetical protein